MNDCKDRKLPNSYYENSRQEIEVLELADNFHRQFTYLYKDRIKPPLYLENECNVRKLTCSYICPFKVSMPAQMKKWDFCANFFADFFDYELLQPFIDCPQRLSSVENILKRRKGNSLDLSTVLCTFLLASNYDAYVIQGYARRNICEKLENSEIKPPIRFDTSSEYHKLYFRSTDEVTPKPNKYQLNFDLVKAFWMEGKSMFQVPDEPRQEAELEEFEEDIYLGKRIHFWILMCSYEKDILKSFFIEPTTGEKKSVDDLNYLGIEFAWNNKNFWCNNQNAVGSCKNIKYYFNDSQFWEAFLPQYSISEECGMPIRMPEAWGRDIEITMEGLKNRFPPQGKRFHYKKAEVEKYNPEVLKDNLIYRMTYFKTENKNDPTECHAFFLNRKDFLEYRKTDFEKQVVEDIFSPGRSDSMKQHEYSLKSMSAFPQKMIFYSHLRKDQLSLRMWANTVTVDEFADRSDFLTKREINYFPETPYLTEIKITNRARVMGETSSMSNEPSATIKDNGMQTERDIKVSNESAEHSEINSLEKETKTSENVENLTVEIVTEAGGEKEKSEEINSVLIGSSSFDALSMIFEDVDFSSWTIEFFLDSLEPAERYATSESETEEQNGCEDNIDAEQRSYGEEITNKDTEKTQYEKYQEEKVHIQDVYGTDEEMDEDGQTRSYDLQQKISVEKISHPNTENISDPTAVDEKEPTEEGELDKEIELYDEINFDALSDEELEIDYQLFLSKLWGEYNNDGREKLFYMAREFSNHKDIRSKETLKLKKKIVKKRRKNVRYLQRKETGKASVRTFKKKYEEGLKRQKSIYTDDLINYLNLQENLGIVNTSSLDEFRLITNLEKIHVDAANAELIKKECLKLLDKRLRNNQNVKTLNKLQNVRTIKNTYRRDPLLPIEQSIRNISFDIEKDSYRIDFHYLEGQSSRKILFLIKPGNNIDFTFSDYLCRQILPSFETKPTKRIQMYSYLVALMKKELPLWEELSRFEDETKQILETRQLEEKATKAFLKKIPPETPGKVLYYSDSEEYTIVTEQVEETKDIISYTIEKLNLSLPLSVDDGKKLYDEIFNEFCDEAFKKYSDLEKEFKKLTAAFSTFLEQCKSWKEKRDEQEILFVKTCAKFSALISSIKSRCNAQRENTKSNFIQLKKKLYYDSRLQAYIAKATESQRDIKL